MNSTFNFFSLALILTSCMFFLTSEGFRISSRNIGLSSSSSSSSSSYHRYHHAKRVMGKITAYSSSSSRDLSMHMGHSHTHSHHDDDDDDDHEHDHNTAISRNKMSGGGPSSGWGKVVQIPTNNPRARVFLCAVLFLIPIAIRRKLTKVDISVFTILTVSLSLFNDVKKSATRALKKLTRFQQGLMKHTTPLTKAYFFRNENSADRVTLLGVWTNILLSVVKLAGGVTFNSAVLVADAGHSLSDLLSDFITLWVVQIARLPPDEDHPYGHGKFESVGALFLSITLLATGLGVGSWSYERMHQVLLASSSNSLQKVVLPSWPALLIAAFSIFSKEWLFRVTKRVGTLLNSQVIIANAWHHRSDAFSSVLSLASIAMAIYLPGLLAADSASGILIAGMISVTGLEIMIESVKQLTDTSDNKLTSKIESITKNVDGVEAVADVRSRSIGSGNLVDLTLLVENEISSSAASAIGEKVKWNIMDEIPTVMDVLVRTVANTVKVCPLLVNVETRSVADIEEQVRDVIGKEPDVSKVSVPKVTVHFIDNALVRVEVVVNVNDVNMSLKDASGIASRIRNDLTQNNHGIHEADIYIDTAVVAEDGMAAKKIGDSKKEGEIEGGGINGRINSSMSVKLIAS